MHAAITHVKLDRNRIVAVGAWRGGRLIWKATVDEAVRQARAGVRFVATFVNRDALEVVVEPSTLHKEARLRTVEDTVCRQHLRDLPKFPE